ncbi:hypothetical protein ACFC0M_07075 [Streptomyces sp. NPDC056149]|uniref:phage distal tail protein n=1 Tax=Streptomyces sp. NPDC056149 TaxID=3345728 RepID=UPI0035D7ED74
MPKPVITFRGLVLDHTRFGWQTLTGWEDLPTLDAADTLRPDAHGSWPGRLLAQPRTITVEGISIRARGEIGAAVAELNAATTVADTEAELVVDLDERGPLVAFARCTRRHLPVDRFYAASGITQATGALQFEAPDPRRYSITAHSLWTLVPQREPGLAWERPMLGKVGELDWGSGADTGLEWGQPGSTGRITAVNSGTAPAHPLITFTGPLDHPVLTHQQTGRFLAYDLVLAAGETLVVDTVAGTVQLGHPGASRLHTAAADSSPERTFLLAPGENTLALRDQSLANTTGAVNVTWRDAYW